MIPCHPDQAEDFQGNDGKNTGHNVQDQAPDEGKKKVQRKRLSLCLDSAALEYRVQHADSPGVSASRGNCHLETNATSPQSAVIDDKHAAEERVLVGSQIEHLDVARNIGYGLAAGELSNGQILVLSGASRGLGRAVSGHNTDNGTGGTIGSCPVGGTGPGLVSLGDRIIVQVTATYRPLLPLVNLPSFPITSRAARTLLRNNLKEFFSNLCCSCASIPKAFMIRIPVIDCWS